MQTHTKKKYFPWDFTREYQKVLTLSYEFSEANKTTLLPKFNDKKIPEHRIGFSILAVHTHKTSLPIKFVKGSSNTISQNCVACILIYQKSLLKKYKNKNGKGD